MGSHFESAGRAERRRGSVWHGRRSQGARQRQRLLARHPSDDDWIAANAAAQRLGISARGFIEMEIDRGLLPEAYRPREGDRMAVWGRWIVDCGHSIFSTEIHPPLVLASARAVSADTTSVRLVGRAFLVSQDYGG